MPEKTAVEKAVFAAFERDRHINLHRFPIRIEFDIPRAAITLEGEVEDIIAKKRAFALASRVDGVEGVMDYLRVAPRERLGDGAIRTAVTNALLQEPALRACAIRARHGEQLEVERAVADAAAGVIDVSVHEGIIDLTGRVGSLSHKRLAGVLAWWAPGCRDVINGMQVSPPEDDNDGEIADALRLVLEKDPLVHADQISVRVRGRVVTLQGSVATREERKMAEYDAWYLVGVSEVVNDISARR